MVKEIEMTPKELKKLNFTQTRSVAGASIGNDTYNYICDCMDRLFRGDYGDCISEEDRKANDRELMSGEGHILARYPKRYKLEDDIYISVYFSESSNDPDNNKLLVMYVSEL